MLATGIAPGPALLFFGLWYVVAGFIYRQPIPIEPMKTVAVVGIAGQATAGEVVAGGLLLGVLAGGVPAPAIPLPSPVLLAAADWLPALLVLVLPQAVLTLTNSIAATELLARDLLSRPPMARLLSRVIGVMNLIAVPLGGIPICHGAGGLAAQYRFGARTGVSNALAGLVLVLLAIFAASPTAGALPPTGLLAALLLLIALELARVGFRTDAPVPTVVVALVSIVTSLTVGSVVGWLVLWGIGRWRPRPG